MADRDSFLLTDNGSLRPEATLSLRRLAEALGREVGAVVHPVSLLHSGKIDPAELGGQRADTFQRFVLAQRERGVHRFFVTPLFFGPSGATQDYLPERVAAIREERSWPELEVRVAPCLVDVSHPDDNRVAQILADGVVETAGAAGLSRASVALCDHGAPRPSVTAVRDHLACQLRGLLDRRRFPAVAPCSMERRPGDEFAFNEPLLENLLGRESFDREVVVSMLFFQPGRHAGESGDVAQICDAAEARHPGLATFRTTLVGAHPGLVPLLAERFRQGLVAAPVGR
jgi:sirohydrochlorin ferrochelatase